ncbi:hypothetical protein 19_00013 [Pseudomonas phage Epa19]|nr:hypothetical protein 19_00013 [Pseudomonas phage Epa19]
MKVTRVFKTVGPLEGQTIALAGLQFVDGYATYQGQHTEADRLGKFLHRNWQVVVDTGEKAQELTPPPAPPAPEEVPNANQTLGNTRLAEALMKLDPEKDDHWTKLDKPAMSAVEQIFGSADVTRADVEAAIAGFDRNVARKMAAEKAAE